MASKQGVSQSKTKVLSKSPSSKADLKGGAKKGVGTQMTNKKSLVEAGDSSPSLHHSIHIEQKDPQTLFKEAMTLFDSNLAQRYIAEIENSQLMDRQDSKINQNQFRELHSVFQTSLGTSLTSKDYMTMFENSQIDSLIAVINDMQKKYIAKEKDKQ